MEEPKTTSNQIFTSKKPKPHIIIWALTALVVLLAALSGYLGWQYKTVKDDNTALKKRIVGLEAQAKKQAAAPADDADVADEAACNDTPSETMKDNIKATLDSQNTAAFATYFSNPVRFVIAASEKGGDETPDAAAVDMEYANTATGPWDFNLPAATIAAYDGGFYTDYFDANTYVGRAASKQVAAFDFDCNGKINKAFLVASEDIL